MTPMRSAFSQRTTCPDALREHGKPTMNILVTGATGFVGNHVVRGLLERGHTVAAVVRDLEKVASFSWAGEVTVVACDIHQPLADPLSMCAAPDVVIHLAWPGLDDYRSLAHIEATFPADCRFLRGLIDVGVKHLVVAGTCFEYGLQDGCLDEGMATNPVIPYAIAKDSLRRFLQALQQAHPFRLQWARIFYPYGDGQKSNSLLSQLNSVIERGECVFPMSGGEQLRDFLPVEEVAARFVALAETPSFDGIINICSGNPVSVRRFVEEYLVRRNASIRLDLGRYPYPVHEPMAFWGSSKRMRLMDTCSS